MVQAAVRGDPVQPRAQRRAPLEVLEATPRRDERLLHEILRVLHRADDPVAVQLQLATQRLRQRLERDLVARPRAREQLPVVPHAPSAAMTRRSASAS
jgi:hypothetical protein